MAEENGKWVTIHGHRVFLKDKNAQKKKILTNKIFSNEQPLPSEWNGKNESATSHMNNDLLTEILRKRLENSGLVDPVTVNDKTTGFFGKRGINTEAIKIETSGPGANLNSKIWNVKLFEENAKTSKDKKAIKQLKEIFKDYL